MPRVRHSSRDATYWGSPELESKRRDCVLARRKLQHAKRRNTRNKVAEDQLRLLRYRETVISLQRGIREAKSRAWSELITTIDHDPWGRPYRLFLGKLKPSTPLTESLEPEMLERVLTTLFPRDASEIPATEAHLTEYDLLVPVTQAELHAAVRKMTAKITAPGPDGVSGKALALALTLDLN